MFGIFNKRPVVSLNDAVKALIARKEAELGKDLKIELPDQPGHEIKVIFDLDTIADEVNALLKDDTRNHAYAFTDLLSTLGARLGSYLHDRVEKMDILPVSNCDFLSLASRNPFLPHQDIESPVLIRNEKIVGYKSGGYDNPILSFSHGKVTAIDTGEHRVHLTVTFNATPSLYPSLKHGIFTSVNVGCSTFSIPTVFYENTRREFSLPGLTDVVISDMAGVLNEVGNPGQNVTVMVYQDQLFVVAVGHGKTVIYSQFHNESTDVRYFCNNTNKHKVESIINRATKLAKAGLNTYCYGDDSIVRWYKHNDFEFYHTPTY